MKTKYKTKDGRVGIFAGARTGLTCNDIRLLIDGEFQWFAARDLTRCPQKRAGFIELFLLFIVVAVIALKFYLIIRVVDLAEQDMRKQNNLPEKEMITDKLHNAISPEETPEQKIKRLEDELKKLKEDTK